MEKVENPSYSPHLKKVLKSYQTAAMTSLSGPNTFMAAWGNSPSKSHCSLVGAVDLEVKKAVVASPFDSVGGNNHRHLNGNHTSNSSNNNSNLNSTNSVSNNKLVSTKNSSSPSSANDKKHYPSPPPLSTTASAAAAASPPSPQSAKYPDYDPFVAPPPFPIQQLPILTAPDQSRSERSETHLEGEVISCFLVGGEKRLCLPQILNSVLRDFSLQQINAVCDELQIFCSRCSHEQLEVLKVTGILPFSAPSCGLITKTDAERLCNALLHSHPPRAVHDLPPEKRPFHFLIYHECFGKCKGIYTPDHYTTVSARCIECTECHGLFSPQKFVGHAHKALENRTCHWGFDSAHWRSYILLAKDQEDMEQLQVHLEELKVRFDSQKKVGVGGSGSKRKQVEVEERELIKKMKYEETYYPFVYDPMLAYFYGGVPALSRVSAFRPWSPVITKDGKLNLPVPQMTFMRDTVPQSLPPYLSRGPPVLLNPERVVPISETERFERHYQPNVALAPQSAQIQAIQKAHSVNSSSAPSKIASPRSCSTRVSTKTQAVTSTSPPPRNPEIELSTDTDETFSDSTTSSSTESPTCSPSRYKQGQGSELEMPVSGVKVKVEVEAETTECGVDSEVVRELNGIRSLMEEVEMDKEYQDRIMERVSGLCSELVLKLEKTMNSEKRLLQHLEEERVSKKEGLREASKAKRHLRKEMERMFEEQTKRERELNMLKQENDALRRCKGEKAYDPCQSERMRSKIEGMGEELVKLQEELQQLRKCGNMTQGSSVTGLPEDKSGDATAKKTERLLSVVSHLEKGAGERNCVGSPKAD